MRGVFRSIKVSVWFMLLTFPLLCMRVDTLADPPAVQWRLINAVWLGLAIFVLSFAWRGMMVRKGALTPEEADLVWLFRLLGRDKIRNWAVGLLYCGLGCVPVLVQLFEKGSLAGAGFITWIILALGLGAGITSIRGRRAEAREKLNFIASNFTDRPQLKIAAACLLLAVLFALPIGISGYQTKVLTQALIWVALGLGLNIIVGQAGLLVLGYMAFYAVGAYTYGIINHNLPMIGFWPLLPLGGLLAVIAGLALGFPVLRLRGDYLAIVTLGFGEIVNQVLLNLKDITGGSDGIAGIPKPGFFGLDMSPQAGAVYVYYLAILLALVSIVAVGRLRDSRLGRSWMAMREDEVACETMGIDKTRVKLTAFALGACWAGLGGVLFAAKESFVNPMAFSFMESITILCVVVLGGLGSIWGVVLGAVIIVALPEYLRAFAQYRMLLFGACLVLMMVFKPQGLVKPRRKNWVILDAELYPAGGKSGRPGSAAAPGSVPGPVADVAEVK